MSLLWEHGVDEGLSKPIDWVGGVHVGIIGGVTRESRVVMSEVLLMLSNLRLMLLNLL